MNKNWQRATLALALSIVAGAASAATVDRIVLNDGSTDAFRNPWAAVDADGNVHVVAQGQPNDLAGSDDVYYYRLSSGGTIRTAEFAVTTTDVGAGRPHVVATSAGMAVVAWKEGSDIMAALIDPANGGSIADGPDIISDNPGGGSAGHFSMAIGADDDVHFIINADSGVYHVRMAAADLTVEVAQHLISSTYWRGVMNSVAVDDAGNVHAVVVPSGQAPSYTMLDADGATLIDETLLNVDGHEGNHVGIVADSNGEVRIAYSDKRFTFAGSYDPGSEGGAMFQVTIDPSAHTGGTGNAGDIDELRVGDDLLIGHFWYGMPFVGSDGEFRAVAGTGGRGSGSLNYYRVNGSTVRSGNVAANNQGWQYYRKLVTGAGSMVVWPEAIFVPTPEGVSTQLVAAKVSAFDASTVRKSGDSGAFSPALVLLLGLAGLARAGYRRRA